MVYLVNHKGQFFDEKEARLIFRENEKYLNSPFSFHEIKNNDLFFAVMNEKGETIGICYALMDEIKGKKYPFYSGAFKRKHHKEALIAHNIFMRILFNYYEKVYTWTPHLHARMFNKQAGMKETSENSGVFCLDKKDFKEKGD